MSKPSGRPSVETDLIDSMWDDDASGEIPLGEAQPPDESFDRITAIPSLPQPEYVKRAMAAAATEENADAELASGLQEKETPAAGTAPGRSPLSPDFELELPPLVMPGSGAPAQHLAMDEPAVHPADDLSLELGSEGPDPMDSDAEAAPASLELELETPAAAPAEDDGVAEMRNRYAAGDFTGALIVAESLLETDPEHPDAKRYVQSCRDVLTQMYAARLGPLDQTVHVAIPPDQVRWLSLDHRAGFLLSLVDGSSSVEEILDVSGMTRLDALRIVYTLFEQQIISLSGGSA